MLRLCLPVASHFHRALNPLSSRFAPAFAPLPSRFCPGFTPHSRVRNSQPPFAPQFTVSAAIFFPFVAPSSALAHRYAKRSHENPIKPNQNPSIASKTPFPTPLCL